MILPGLASCTPGQDAIANKSGCSVVDKTRPPLYVSLERESDNESASKNQVTWLRLHNNLNCGVVIETSDINPWSDEYRPFFREESFKEPNGSTAFQYTLAPPPEGATLPLLYDIQDPKSKKAPRPANYWGGRCLVITWILPPAGTIVFSVKKEFFDKRKVISIPFRFEWESEADFNQIFHRVYYRYEFPRGFYEGDESK